MRAASCWPASVSADRKPLISSFSCTRAYLYTPATMLTLTSVRKALDNAATRAVFASVALAAIVACNDAAGPHRSGPSVRIVPVADSVFEGDVVRLTAVVLDDAGVEVPGAPVTWTASDPTLARDAGGDGSFALLAPGMVRITARSGTASATYDLTIGRLAVKRVDLTPGTLDLGRGDRPQLTARVLGQGDRVITGRSVTYTSDDTLVAVVGSPDNVIGAPGFLIAVGPGSTTIRASADGVTGTTRVNVVIADTTFSLTEYNFAPVPVLIAADSVLFNGVPEFDEVYAEAGTLVRSGLLQPRYTLEVRYSQYRVTRTGTTVQRELRFQQREFDRGVVTTKADGNLSMLSELIGPHLEHTAFRESDGFRVHFQIPGDDLFLDLTYRRDPR